MKTHPCTLLRQFGIMNVVNKVNWPPFRISKLTFQALALQRVVCVCVCVCTKKWNYAIGGNIVTRKNKNVCSVKSDC